MEFYAAHKTINPQDKITLRPFLKRDVESVDKLVKLSRGSRDYVQTESDWQVICSLIEFFIQRWPNEWMEFRNTMPDIRETRRSGGYSQSKEILYLLALPFRLERLIKIIFPNNKFNKKFSYEFIRRFKAFRVAGEGN